MPEAPPVAGPDRAFDAPPADPLRPAEPLADAVCAGVDEPDIALPTDSPITAHMAATAAAVHRRLLVASSRPTQGRRACSAVDAGTGEGGGEAGGGGGLASVPELLAAEGSEVALDAGRRVRVSWAFVGPRSVMTALLLIVSHAESTQRSWEVPRRRLGGCWDHVRTASAAGSMWRRPQAQGDWTAEFGRGRQTIDWRRVGCFFVFARLSSAA